MLRKICIISFCVVLLSNLSGCRDANLIKSSYEAADTLISQVKPPLIPHQAVLMASFVNIDNLEESSTFGRSIAEYIGTRFTQNGYKVIEMKLRKSIFMKRGAGEFLLSRDLKLISTRHNAQAIVVGTYSVAKSVIYVSARIIKLSDSSILSAHAYKLPLGKNARKMLGIY
ncbi:FlgO family outer membrane protein [Desulfobacterales bacterium HSG2]|nr:FlgO family outer membrane protein [Desulfobacterales bacterium HSG2]